MKIKRHVVALGLAAGLTGMFGPPFASQYSAISESQVGYWVAKSATENFDLDEDEADAVELAATAAGVSAGLLTGAVVGAKVGSLGGPIGTVIGAAIGGL